MISMEREALDAIAKNGGRLHYYLVAGELRISSGYAYVICKGLKRNGYINFDIIKSKGICSLTEKGKDVIEKGWVFELKKQKENIQKRMKENKQKFLKCAEIVNY